MSDYATTGDGLIGALQVLAVLQRQQKSASEALNLFTPLPQILRNVRYSGADPLEKKPVIDAIVKAEKALSKNGRLFIRKSGTEPLIRIMAEGDDQGQIDTLTAELAEIIENNISNAA